MQRSRRLVAELPTFLDSSRTGFAVPYASLPSGVSPRTWPLEAGEEVVYVRMGEQVDRRVADTRTSHRQGRGRAVRGSAAARCRRSQASHRRVMAAPTLLRKNPSFARSVVLRHHWDGRGLAILNGVDRSAGSVHGRYQNPRPRPCPSRCRNTTGRRKGRVPADGGSARRHGLAVCAYGCTRRTAVRRSTGDAVATWPVSPSGRVRQTRSACLTHPHVKLLHPASRWAKSADRTPDGSEAFAEA